MLTDEELSTRLIAALHDSAPDMTYTGRIPRVGRRVGLVAPSALAVTATLVLAPAALQHEVSPPRPVPIAGSRGQHAQAHKVVHTLDVAGILLSSASVEGNPGPLYYVGGDHMTVPADAEQVDLGLPVNVYFVDAPGKGEPQVYISSTACPDTTDGCNGAPPPTTVYGILAPGWSRQQLMQLLEHPVSTEHRLSQ